MIFPICFSSKAGVDLSGSSPLFKSLNYANIVQTVNMRSCSQNLRTQKGKCTPHIHTLSLSGQVYNMYLCILDVQQVNKQSS
jgi:hypothetical protein